MPYTSCCKPFEKTARACVGGWGIMALTQNKFINLINPLTPELNPSAQRCLTRFFIGDFSS
jgi:hypothetical protein